MGEIGSRRRREASARNRVPEALVLPPAPPDTQWPASYRSPDLTPHPDPDEHRTPDLFLQLVAYGGYRYEKPAEQYWTALTSRLPRRNYDLVLHKWDTPPILFQGVEDGLAVRFSWHEIPGAPARHSLHLWERSTQAQSVVADPLQCAAHVLRRWRLVLHEACAQHRSRGAL